MPGNGLQSGTEVASALASFERRAQRRPDLPVRVLGSGQQGVSREYLARLPRAFCDTHVRFRLPAPAGRGEHEPGRAVFSVSPSMDFLPPLPDS